MGPGYVCGGFLGGRTPDFLRLARDISEGINSDDSNEVLMCTNASSKHLLLNALQFYLCMPYPCINGFEVFRIHGKVPESFATSFVMLE